MFKTWKINNVDVSIGRVDKYFREVVLGCPIASIAAVSGIAPEIITMHEAGNFNVSAHNAYFEMCPDYEYWINHISYEIGNDIIGYQERCRVMKKYESFEADALKMSDDEFNEFSDAACYLAGAVV